MKQQEIDLEDQFYDEISMKMVDTLDKNSSNLFSDSRLISEYDAESRIYLDVKKKSLCATIFNNILN